MIKKTDRSVRILFVGIIIIALGITLTNTLKDSSVYLGTVLIGVGGLFFIAGMAARNKESRGQEKK